MNNAPSVRLMMPFNVWYEWGSIDINGVCVCAWFQCEVLSVSGTIKCLYSKTCLKRNAIVPVFFFRFHMFPFYKGLCFNKTKYKKYDRLELQWRNNLK